MSFARSAVPVEHDEFAVDDKAFCGQGVQLAGDVQVLGGDVVTVAREEAGWAAVADRHDAEAIMLDLKNPVAAVEGLAGALYDLERELVRP